MHKQNLLIKENKFKKHARHANGVFFIFVKLIPTILLVLLSLVIVGLIIAAISILPNYAAIKAAYSFSQGGKAELYLAKDQAMNQDFGGAAISLKSAADDFAKAGKQVETLQAVTFLKINYFKEQLSVAHDLLFIGQKSAETLQNLALVGKDVKDKLKQDKINFASLTEAQKEQMLSVLFNNAETFSQLGISLNTINQSFAEVQKKNPSFLFDPIVKPLKDELPAINAGYSELVSLSQLFPAFLGFPSEKTYLILLQNNREMRPSGGFIGAYGILKIQNATIKEFFIDNSYNLDVLVKDTQKIPSPPPIAKYMVQPNWFFRDANWSPDFIESSSKAAWFYELEGGKEKLDGVIAFTPTLIEKLIGYLGAFDVMNLNFNQTNFWEQLEYQVEYGYNKQGIPEEDRKDIIGELGKSLIGRLFALPLNKWPDIIDIVKKQVDEKQICLNFYDKSLAKLAEDNNFDGRVKDFSGDYLMLIDANLAALKTDSVMSRTLKYDLKKNDKNELIANTSVTYQNMGGFSWKTTRYRTYSRLYVPAGSELISVKAGNKEFKKEDIDTYQELGKTAFGVFFEVEPQAAKTVVWQYKLPANITANNDYSLMVQKQIGLEKLHLQLNIDLGTKKFTTGEELITDKVFEVKVSK